MCDNIPLKLGRKEGCIGFGFHDDSGNELSYSFDDSLPHLTFESAGRMVVRNKMVVEW